MKPTTTKRRIGGKIEPNVTTEQDPALVAEQRRDAIATAAYFKAKARNFAPGREADDWFEAEAEFLK